MGMSREGPEPVELLQPDDFSHPRTGGEEDHRVDPAANRIGQGKARTKHGRTHMIGCVR